MINIFWIINSQGMIKYTSLSSYNAALVTFKAPNPNWEECHLKVQIQYLENSRIAMRAYLWIITLWLDGQIECNCLSRDLLTPTLNRVQCWNECGSFHNSASGEFLYCKSPVDYLNKESRSSLTLMTMSSDVLCCWFENKWSTQYSECWYSA